MLERAAACGGAIARYRNIYGAEHGSEGTQQGNGSRGWRGRDRRRLQTPDGVHRTVGPVLGRHRTPQIASGPLDSVHGIGDVKEELDKRYKKAVEEENERFLNEVLDRKENKNER